MHIRVPPDARIWFENQETKQRGAERDFMSPPLLLGQGYTYHLRAEWVENGQLVTRTREFSIRAGQSVNLDLMASR